MFPCLEHCCHCYVTLSVDFVNAVCGCVSSQFFRSSVFFFSASVLMNTSFFGNFWIFSALLGQTFLRFLPQNYTLLQIEFIYRIQWVWFLSRGNICNVLYDTGWLKGAVCVCFSFFTTLLVMSYVFREYSTIQMTSKKQKEKQIKPHDINMQNI